MSHTYVSQKLRVCLVAFHLPVRPRAFENSQWLSLARELAERGHEVIALTWQNDKKWPEWEFSGVRVFSFAHQTQSKTQMGFAQQIEKKFIELHREKPFDIVHTFHRSAYRLGRQKKTLKFGFVADIETTQISTLFHIMSKTRDSALSQLFTAVSVTKEFLSTYFSKDRRFLKICDAVLAATPRQQTVLERFYLYPFRKTFLVPQSVDLYSIADFDEQSFLKKWNLTSQNKLVLAYSEMNDLRETETLFKAFQKISIKKPNARLVLLGHGPKFKEIEYKLLMLALGHKCILPGLLSDDEQNALIHKSDIVVGLNAQTAGFEPSVLEGMAAKKVVIASELSPMNALIEDGVSGFLVRPGDEDELSDLILSLLSDEFSTREIGLRAFELIETQFNPSKVAELCEAAYSQVLRRPLSKLQADRET